MYNSFGCPLGLRARFRFRDKIFSIRNEELRHVWTVFLVAAFNICLLWMAPCVVAVVTIAVYAQGMQREVTAAKIFTALSLFRMLQEPLRSLPGTVLKQLQCTAQHSTALGNAH